MSTILDKLKQLFQQPTQSTMISPSEAGISQLDSDNLKKLMHLVEHTDPDAYSCEEAFELLDEYADLVAASDREDLMPFVRHHLERCPGCHEQYEALMAIINDMPSPSA